MTQRLLLLLLRVATIGVNDKTTLAPSFVINNKDAFTVNDEQPLSRANICTSLALILPPNTKFHVKFSY